MNPAKLVTALLLAVFSITLAANPEPWSIQGNVISVVEEEGIIVVCTDYTSFGRPRPAGGDVVFVRGKFPLVDGDPVNFVAEPDGTFHYISASNAAKTIRAFKLRR